MALSGGGDSVALTLMADAWARKAGRDLLILTVDHGLNPRSPAWTEACAALARRLDRPFRALAWTGLKPATGLPAAARAARHRLLADAARAAGARVILMGHTADDLAEAAAMRAAGSTVPDAREWAPSPAWPEGRGVFLLRPMLHLRRSALRDGLAVQGETWIEDPANADARFARARARAAGPPAPSPLAPDAALPGAGAVSFEDTSLHLDRAVLCDLPAPDAARLIALACVCAGGGPRRPAGARIARAAQALRSGADGVSTLAGARIIARGPHIRIAREPGEAARGGLRPLDLTRTCETVWDGRYAIRAHADGLTVRPDRHGRPMIVTADGTVTTAADIHPLVPARFRAAAGLVAREP